MENEAEFACISLCMLILTHKEDFAIVEPSTREGGANMASALDFKVKIKMFPHRDPAQPFRWLAFRGYWSDGYGLKLPSDLMLADSRGAEDEVMDLYHPRAAYSRKFRVWYSPALHRYFFISYIPDHQQWHGHQSKAKSLEAALAELEDDKKADKEFQQAQLEAAEAELLREARAREWLRANLDYGSVV